MKRSAHSELAVHGATHWPTLLTTWHSKPGIRLVQSESAMHPPCSQKPLTQAQLYG